MRRIKVGVLMGGESTEHEVSIISGENVVKNLDKSRYKVTKYVIPKKGGFNFNKLLREDIVFIALHGTFGEDGRVQGLCEMMKVAYTGSGVLTSALGMDKLLFRKVMDSFGILVPKYISLNKNEGVSKHEVEKSLGKLPYFVKPHNQGSSVGASVVKKWEDLNKVLKQAFRYSETVLIDEYISGTELTCAVIGNKNPRALPLIEIEPLKGNFFDYKSKYESGGANEIVPARISSQLTKEIQEIACRIYRILGCRGFSRIDFIVQKGKPYVLEINTIPGLTPMSLFPKAAKNAGINYSTLLDKLIKYGLDK
ncbi:hypothetical protein A2382_00955 [Candidatus Woesebacteria bacterium RIFOXYB1_FULL_38_16]|uniref:D-alanine--D-alanine ligase n=1 Tax=Candidatus Woesebacteria bacterium RIFOXYB1_FULL_38_16 TaxID=1802538 RepID=A0A1F8CSP5_9BACT|nr:MAG: hypothetical protein A2191_00670 [Candidatus Woesebacteria bacterium RIFOXYA1_FULL_38_9]OGM79344.1 MAG: hypothetical protein A2382_00955 [Candidatus Woesebacteria bacterium RIFOXYB1_FULL_38_16]